MRQRFWQLKISVKPTLYKNLLYKTLLTLFLPPSFLLFEYDLPVAIKLSYTLFFFNFILFRLSGHTEQVSHLFKVNIVIKDWHSI